MITHNLIQGSDSWHAYRASHDNASDAPAVMGCSTYKTREQLLAERATGIVPEVDAATQRRFDAGHRFEALARPLAEAIIGEDLYPCTGSLEDSRLSASFDGLTLLENIAFEHKSLNQRLRAVLEAPGCTGADLPMEYQIQLEQQCAVSGCEKILFMASAWDGEDQLIEEQHCWYTPNLELRARILAGWEQFHKDVAAYAPPEAAAVVNATAKVRDALPALIFDAKGEITACNVDEFKAEVLERINTVNTSLVTDQDFADGEADAKWLRDVAAGMKAAMQRVRSGMASVHDVLTTLEQLEDMAAKRALAVEKLVKARKDEIRAEIVLGGAKALSEHIAALNARLEHPYMPQVPADFGGVVKNKRTLDSLRNAVNTELARAKIETSAIADRIEANLKTMQRLAGGYTGMLPDAPTLVLKAADDFEAAVNLRVAERVRRENERLEAERERIRLEEQVKLQREAEAKARAEALAAPKSLNPLFTHALTFEEIDARITTVEPESTMAAELAKPTQNVANIPLIRGELGAVDCAVRIVDRGPRTGTPTLKLGQIAERLGFSLTADFLNGLGFEPAATDRSSKLYHEADFTLILTALVRHLERVQARAAA